MRYKIPIDEKLQEIKAAIERKDYAAASSLIQSYIRSQPEDYRLSEELLDLILTVHQKLPDPELKDWAEGAKRAYESWMRENPY